jgi:hypothetical protein
MNTRCRSRFAGDRFGIQHYAAGDGALIPQEASPHSMAAPIATNDTICDGEIEKIQEQSSCRGFGQTIVLRNFLRNGESLQNSCREEGQPRLFILWRV